jgi:hypothetical protein
VRICLVCSALSRKEGGYVSVNREEEEVDTELSPILVRSRLQAPDPPRSNACEFYMI